MTPGSIRKFLASTIGSKFVVGATGLLLVAFLVVHLAENLLLLAGPASFNRYVHLLTSNPLIVPLEIGLALLFLVHIFKAIAFTIRNRRARPESYVRKRSAGAPSRKSLASTTMPITGVLVLAFLVMHLLDFKWGTEYIVEGSGERDLHRTVVEYFASPLNVALYVLAMVVVGFHLRHGIASAFQSLGVEHPTWTPRIMTLGWILAVVIAGGFAALALAVHFQQGGQP